MSIILNGTTGITTPDVTADSGESLTSRVAKSGDTMTGNLNQVKSMTSQYDGIGVLMGSSTANTNRSATFLQHTYIDAGGNQGNYVYNHSLRQTDGAYIANVYTADYSAGVHSWYNPNGGLSGNVVMRIDNAGRVTMPYQPAWAAKFLTSKSQSLNTPILFDSVAINIGSHYNGSTGIFTAPVAGRYQVNVHVLKQSGGSTYMNLKIAINGASKDAVYGNAYTNQLSGEVGFGTSWVVSLEVNDTLAIWLGSGSTVSLYSTETMWSGHFIG